MSNTKKIKKNFNKKTVKKKTKKCISNKEINVLEAEVIKEKKENATKKISKKRSSVIKKKYLPIIGIIIIVIIAFVLTFSFLSNPCGISKFSFTIQGIPYCSNTYTPTSFFDEFTQNNTYYVSPILEESGADPLIANAMNLWQVVLIGNGKETVQLIRVKVDGQISYCYTNKGDVQTAEQISLEECNSIINNKENTIVLLEEGREKIVMEKNKLQIYTSNSKVIGQVNFAVIKQFFPNAQTILDTVNEKIYGIN